uniref:Syntaphilin n=1 Tax=Myripristis murdjan TaxID=586833 RepID=A0A667ZWY0_9TELE
MVLICSSQNCHLLVWSLVSWFCLAVVATSSRLTALFLLWTRRTPAPPSNRDPYGNTSLSSSSNSGSCKGSDCSPTKGRHQKYTSCTDNHGIRPPPPEQYLTPLQQKEVCIRHLRARLKETIDRLQDRDTEIDELRGQLSRMQEDWVEEECHRVEAQLALKEARREIQQLKHAVDTVRASLSDAGGLSGDGGVQKYFQDINTQNHKLENLLLSMELAQTGMAKDGEVIPGENGRGTCSCDASPARSLTRSSTYTKLSDQVLADRNGNGPDFPCLSGEGTQDSGFVCCGENSIPSRADLLLEAAFLLSHTLPHTLPHNLSHTLPHSSTYEKLCTGGEQGILELGECTEEIRHEETKLEQPSGGKRQPEVELLAASTQVETAMLNPRSPEVSPGFEKPHTSQPRRSTSHEEMAGVSAVEVHDKDAEGETDREGASEGTAAAEGDAASESGPVQKSYWSRHFLVDLLAVAVPVVPTVAWLCRGPVREGQPMYHIGSLLRGCCTVALHSLRRGGGLRHYPAGGGDLGGSNI